MLEKIYQNLIEGGAFITILKGLGVTLQISVFALIIGTVLGMLVCMARMSNIRILSSIAKAYIAILRGSPVLMLLLLMYYVIFAKSSLSAEWIAIITFACNVAAYVAELFRSAILATDKGQVEAARTLGFSAFDAFKLITLPQAVNIAEPVYESTIINLIQWTSVVGYVAITDLTRVINTFSARTMQPLFMIITGMIIYFALSCLVSFIFDVIRKNKKKEA